LNPNISGLFEPQLSQKANNINFGNRNGKSDIPHYNAALLYSDTKITPLVLPVFLSHSVLDRSICRGIIMSF